MARLIHKIAAVAGDMIDMSQICDVASHVLEKLLPLIGLRKAG